MKQERKRTGNQAEDEIDRFLKAQERRERRKTISTILIVVALLLGAAAALQYLVGVATLLLIVPISLAALHQAIAALLLNPAPSGKSEVAT